MPAAADPISPALQAALCSVARAIAESLELKQVWGRVAEACRTVVPFDGMGVALLEGDRANTLVVAGNAQAQEMRESSYSFSDFSPLIRPPSPTQVLVVRDTERELDPSFRLDRTMLEGGFRSILRVSLGHRADTTGSVHGWCDVVRIARRRPTHTSNRRLREIL